MKETMSKNYRNHLAEQLIADYVKSGAKSLTEFWEWKKEQEKTLEEKIAGAMKRATSEYGETFRILKEHDIGVLVGKKEYSLKEYYDQIPTKSRCYD